MCMKSNGKYCIFFSLVDTRWLPGPPDLSKAKLDPYYRLMGLGIMREPLSLTVARNKEIYYQFTDNLQEKN